MDDAKRYERTKFLVGITAFALDVLILAFLLVSGWTFRIRDFAAGMTAWESGQVLVYTLILGALLRIVSLPFGYYSDFVLEHRFGLSRQNFLEWLQDMLKSSALGAVLGLAGAQVIYLLLRAYPEQWWLYGAAVFVAFVALMANLAPVLLLPLFFKFKPVEDPELQRRVDQLARRTRTPLCGMFEWSLGDKTRRANAAVVGWGNTRRIIVSDTLLRNFSPEEIEVVVAHELCHHVKNHMWRGMALQAFLVLFAFYCAHVILSSLATMGQFRGISDVANLPLLLLTMTVLSLLVLPVVNSYSRRLERAADVYALDLTGDALAFVSSMEKLAEMNLVDRSPNELIEFIFHSHPSIEERIKLAADRVGQNV